MGRKIGAVMAIVCVVAAIIFLIFGKGIIGNQNVSADATVTITDSIGKEVTIPVKPKRVVILNASNVDLFVAAGGGDNIVGKATTKALSDEVARITEGAEDVGFIHSPNVEKILALKPDLVIGTNVPFHLNLADILEKAGIPLFINSVDNYEQIESSLNKFGYIMGNEEKAQKRIAKIKEDYENITTQVQGKKPLKSMVIFGTPQNFNVATDRTFTGNLIKRLGGINVADNVESGDSQYVPMSMEFLTKENPEVVMMIMMGSPEEMQEKMHKEMENNPAWKTISAVKNNKVHILPYNLFTVNPGVQCIDAMKVLAGYIFE